MSTPILRNIPSVHELLESPPLKGLVDKVSRNVVVHGVRTFLDNFRRDLVEKAREIGVPTPNELADRIASWISSEEVAPLRPVINATGILLHTGLGRAPLADAAVQEVLDVARGYASLEVDLATGERSNRMAAVEKTLLALTGAEAALVVNNNAAATVLALAALAAGREVLVSRGQLIEIGGSFRLPDVMQSSGARLREVGTTNKTRASDYAAALGEQTAALMRVHTSNFRVVGFTEEATLDELVALGKKHHLPVIDDIGSGALIDFSRYGLPDEPLATRSVQAGADLVLSSGDKLLGGPQCGIVVGRKQYVDKLARHPLMRAFRVDKMTLAALAATLRLYRDADLAERSIPLLTLLSASPENLKLRAERLVPQLAALPGLAGVEAVADHTFLGGGSVPAQQLATWCVVLAPAAGNVQALATALRLGSPSVFGRIQQNRLLLDLRSVFPRHDQELVEAVRACVAPPGEPAGA